MNRALKHDERQWSVREIAADPAGAFAYIRELKESRIAWHRKYDKAEQQAKLLRRQLAGTPVAKDGPLNILEREYTREQLEGEHRVSPDSTFPRMRK